MNFYKEHSPNSHDKQQQLGQLAHYLASESSDNNERQEK